jgi:2-oxoglutarate ferredoxin oxidoreductase subunit alpha
MPTRDLSIAMVGSGGDGIVTMGDMVAQAAAKDGLNVIKVEAYGPQIRGGESSCVVRLSPDPIHAQGDFLDVIAVFNWADFGRFKGELLPKKDAVILYEAADPSTVTADDLGLDASARFIPIPFAKLATDLAGTKAAKNILSLAILAELFGLPQASIRKAIEYKFGKKKAELLAVNLKAFDAGAEYVKGMSNDVADKRLTYEVSSPKLLMAGNEAAAVGALHAGCKFFAGYPITPSSEVLHFLSEWLPRVGGSVVQTEDELAAYGAVIGASFAGVKSMTSTSGPGLSLMTEMLGLSSMAEIPSVIWNVQRGGPSTGLPTKSEQSDLWQAVFASHGDAPRAVLAPGDVEDCFHTIVEAFNIAEEYQIPVIVLPDQAVAQRRETVPAEHMVHEVTDRLKPADSPDEKYLRYKDTPSGVSPMSVPGMKHTVYQTNGLEHNEKGDPASMHLTHEKMSKKRYRKLEGLAETHQFCRHYGPAQADVGILCWGSSKGPVQEVVRSCNARGEKVSAFIPQMLLPFPEKKLKDWLGTVKEVLILEISFSGQFYRYLRSFMDLPEDHLTLFKRSGGKNLAIAEVEEEVRKVFEKMKTREEVLA